MRDVKLYLLEVIEQINEFIKISKNNSNSNNKNMKKKPRTKSGVFHFKFISYFCFSIIHLFLN